MITWTSLPLSKLGTLNRGKSKHRPRNDPKLFGGEYPFIQTSDVKHASFYVNSYSETYNESGLKQSKLWPRNTLCMTIAANIAETALLSFPACFPDSVVGFIEDPEKSDVKFVKYALDYYKTQYQKRSQGAAQDNLSLEKIESLKINVPPVHAQKKIADIIFSYDRLIDNNEKRIKVLEEMVQRLYTEWFVKFNFPGHEKVKMIDSPLGKIPEGWSIEFLGDHLKAVEAGKRPKGGIIDSERGVPSVGAENVNGIARHDYGSEKYVSEEFYTSLTKGKVRDKDVAIYKDGAYIGRSTFFRGGFPHEKFCVNEHIFLMRTKNQRLTQNILYLWLQRKSTIHYIRGTNANSAQPGINQNTLSKLKILLPQPEQATNFDALVEPLFEEIVTLARLNRTLAKTRDLLIPQLVTGRRELKNTSYLRSSTKHNFTDAVAFAYYVKQVSTPKFKPTHLRAVKTLYFANRFLGINPVENYAIHQFGPYDPKNTHNGGESIALKKNYVKRVQGGYIVGINISEIDKYGQETKHAIDQVLADLRFKKDTELELLSTVDYVIYDLLLQKKKINAQAVFDYISLNPTWSQKISRLSISIESIEKIISELKSLAQKGLEYPKLNHESI